MVALANLLHVLAATSPDGAKSPEQATVGGGPSVNSLSNRAGGTLSGLKSMDKRFSVNTTPSVFTVNTHPSVFTVNTTPSVFTVNTTPSVFTVNTTPTPFVPSGVDPTISTHHTTATPTTPPSGSATATDTATATATTTKSPWDVGAAVQARPNAVKAGAAALFVGMGAIL
jgi:hypothetical protein